MPVRVNQPVLACAAAAFLLVGVARVSGVTEGLELRLADAAARMRTTSAADSLAALVLASESDLARFGVPLPDSVLGAIVERLRSAGAVGVALDLFREQVDSLSPLHRRASDGFLIFGDKMGDSRQPAVPPPEGLPAGALTGFTDVVPDDDGVIRRMLLIADDGVAQHRALSWQLARVYLAQHDVGEQSDADGLPVLGAWTFTPFMRGNGGYARADDGGYQTVLRFTDIARAFPAFSVADVIDGHAPDSSFRGRMVVVGAFSPSLPDLVRLPVSTVHDAVGGTPGAVLHAMAASWIVQLAQGSATPLGAVSNLAEWILLVVAAFAGAALAAQSRSIPKLAAASIGVVVFSLGGGIASIAAGLWVPTAAPSLAFIGSGALTTAVLSIRERRAREAVTALFARHLSPALADSLWEQRDQFLDGGRPRPQRLFVTVLFVDLRGFSTVGETTEPEALMEWIGRYTDNMARIILDHGGLVDDYAGDGIKADFGAPIPRMTPAEQRDDAIRAVRCAIAMGETVARMNAMRHDTSMPPFAIRIGIASGHAVAGSIGSADRLKYTVVGDVANVAARLESLDTIPFDPTVRPWRILIDASTASLAGDACALESLGNVAVKGRTQPVIVYAVHASREEPTYAF